MAIQQAGWPTEDFQLVTSLVATELPEDDLFAGIGAVRGDRLDRLLRLQMPRAVAW